MVWIVPSVLSQRVSPHWEPLLRSGFLVLLWKLSYVLVNTSADHSPRLRSIFLRGINLHFNSITFHVIRNLDFLTGPIFVSPRLHPLGLDLHHLEEAYILDMNQHIRILPI